jgi:hypothetical protein
MPPITTFPTLENSSPSPESQPELSLSLEPESGTVGEMMEVGAEGLENKPPSGFAIVAM